MKLARPTILALLLIAASPAMAQRTMQLALPTQQPEDPPQGSVGDPDTPPISLDLFDGEFSLEEAWPWPPPSSGN